MSAPDRRSYLTRSQDTAALLPVRSTLGVPVSDKSAAREVRVLAVLLVCQVAAYIPQFYVSDGRSFASSVSTLVLGVTTVALLSVFIVDGGRAARTWAIVGVVVTLALVCGLLWSYAHWTAVAAGSFQSAAAGLWYVSLYSLVVLPVVVALAAVFRIAWLLVAMRHAQS